MWTGRRRSRWCGLALMLLWVQVSTANALPCGIACARAAASTADSHASGSSHAVHHNRMTHHSGPQVGKTVCGDPQLMVAAMMRPDPLSAPATVVRQAPLEPQRALFPFSPAPPVRTPPPRFLVQPNQYI